MMSMSTHRANECITIMLSLRYSQEDTFPSELIQMIVELYWDLWSKPVLVLFTSDNCHHCGVLDDIWYPLPLGEFPKGESILCKLAEMYPGLRFGVISYKNNRDLEHPELYPLRIRDYGRWFPMILLIPGPLWDYAMLHRESDIELIDGVQIFNGAWEDDASLDDALSVLPCIRPNFDRKSLMYHPRCDGKKVDDYVQWFAESLNNPEFIAAQNKLI
jgi:hypothetical protein